MLVGACTSGLLGCSISLAFVMQVRVLRTLHHRNIVQFYGACLEPTSMFFVTELMKVRTARTLQALCAVRT